MSQLPPSSRLPPARSRWALGAGLAVVILAGLWWANRRAPSGLEKISAPNPPAAPRSYGGSASCQECHAAEFSAWAGSHHALAERAPAALDEVAFVPGRTFKHTTQQTSFRQTNGRLEVIAAGLHGTNETFPVQRILAHEPLRQMLVGFPGGRLQVTEAAWDPRSNEWFNVYGQEDRRPGEWGHWTGRGMNWNSMCAACHNTGVQKNYDAATDSYHTTMAETGVGCEACHGPMQAHNDWQHAHPKSSAPDPTVKRFSRTEVFDTCAACHSRRAEITGDMTPGEKFFDHHLLAIADDSGTFFPDGQIAEEDYEVTAFMGSRMFHRGVRCQDCHNVHTMKPKLPGNLLCLSCHGPGATNAPSINPVAHSHHQVFGFDTNGVFQNINLDQYNVSQIKETGGECVNCHMPQTAYMQRHWRHDHGFTIPDPLLTKEFGIPNACNRCHTGERADWSLKFVEQWYGDKMNRPYRQHAQTVARARQGNAAAQKPLLTMLAADDNFYWRAVAANLLARWSGEETVAAALLRALQNTNALVRQMAVASLGAGGSEAAAQPLAEKLHDPSRNVRIEAARLLGATLDTNSLAGGEYVVFLNHHADQPLGQLQAGGFYFQRGETTNALACFQRATEWDAFSGGIRQQYALVLSQLGQPMEAVKQLEAAVRLEPNEAEFHYQLALALNETGETARVLSELEAAVNLDPRHARAWYNLGLARSGGGDSSNALAALTRAENVEPKDPRIPYARATILARLNQLTEARTAARRALELNPDFSAAKELLRQLESR